MTKRAKIFLFTSICILVLIVAGVLIGFAANNNLSNISGTIYVTDLQEGTGKEDWKRYEVDIPYDTTCTERYYTNNPEKGGDYIYDIKFYYEKKRDRLAISYYNYFNFFDDFEAIFVLSNMKEGSEEKYYTTKISNSDWAGYDKIVFDTSKLDSTYSSTGDLSIIKTFHIVELWIRTDD